MCEVFVLVLLCVVLGDVGVFCFVWWYYVLVVDGGVVV